MKFILYQWTPKCVHFSKSQSSELTLENLWMNWRHCHFFEANKSGFLSKNGSKLNSVTFLMFTHLWKKYNKIRSKIDSKSNFHRLVSKGDSAFVWAMYNKCVRQMIRNENTNNFKRMRNWLTLKHMGQSAQHFPWMSRQWIGIENLTELCCHLFQIERHYSQRKMSPWIIDVLVVHFNMFLK